MLKTPGGQRSVGNALESGRIDPPFPLPTRYRFQHELGRGGMGRVFAATDERLGRAVAIKVLAASDAGADAVRRFEQEARAAAQLTHPNIIAIYDIGQHEGVPFIVCELLRGETLRRILDRRRLTIAEALDFASQLLDGLSAAHERGVVHRDLKPENLFITSEGRLKILDFGIAKLASDRSQSTLTDPGSVLGTVAYMSPEQVCGERVDHRTDLFSFGAVLHEMLSGEPPFARSSTLQSGAAILHDDPPELPPTVAPALASVVQRCLAKRRDERFQSAPEIVRDLEGAVSELAAPRRGGLKPAMAALVRAASEPFRRRRERPPATSRYVSGTRDGAGLERDPAAHELYLKGRYYRERYRADAMVKARDCFRRAIEIDPSDPIPYAALADTLTGLYETGRVSANEALPEAMRSAERALALDPQLADAHAALGRVRQGRLDWNGAERAFRRAIELKPGYARAHQFYALMLSWNARGHEALAEVELARQLEPMWLTLYYLLTYVRFARREFSIAEEVAKTARELDPTHPMPHDHLGRIYLATGRYAEAVKEFRHGSVYQSMVPGFLGHALAKCGERDEARRLLAIAPRASAKALICLGLGADEEALAWMERSLEENDIFVKVFKVEPALDPLRSQPRFKALLQKAFFQGETA